MGINGQRIRTYDEARLVIDAYVDERGMDKDAVYTWLVVDEDYFDGMVFTRGQLKREVEWAWRNEQRYRKMVDIVRVACNAESIFAEDKIKAIARTIALNME